MSDDSKKNGWEPYATYRPDERSFYPSLDEALSAATGSLSNLASECNPAWPFPTWERYSFEAFLGQGAMGQIFRVFDPVLKRSVAMKVLNERAMRFAVRFLDEARSQARVDHPNVAKVHEVGEFEGRPYLTMQFLEGESLDIAWKHLGLEERIQVIKQACEGVEAAHQIGLLHRDLKPGNIVVEINTDSHLHAYVVDFGMACETFGRCPETGQVIGTPAFMSPEQAEAKSIDKRSDVFSLGTTLYAILTGHSPFAGQSLESTLRRVALHRPDPPRNFDSKIPKDLEAIVMKAMEKNPLLRYPSAKSLSIDLQRWLDGEPVEAIEKQSFYRLGLWVKKNKALSTLCLLLTLIIATASVWGIRVSHRNRLQAFYYQLFGQEAEQMEASLTLAEALPLHDTQPERQLIRGQIEKIQATIGQLGAVAKAPGLYAMGRGYLALEEWSNARQVLEQAWALGLNTPEVAYSLGTCLKEIYRTSLEEVPAATRKVRQGELDKTLKPLILSYLSIAKRGSRAIMVAIAEAEMARIDGRYEEALAKADEILKHEPWQVKGIMLKAFIYSSQAKNHAQKKPYLQKAKALLNQAREMARSSASVYKLDAEVKQDEMDDAIESVQGASKEEVIALTQAVLEAADKIRQANSLDVHSYQFQSAAIIAQAQGIYFKTALNRHLDPRPDLQKAVDSLDKAMSIIGNSSKLLGQKGQALNRIAEWELTLGFDPSNHLEKAIQSFTKLFETTQSAMDDAYTIDFGSTFLIKGEWEIWSNKNPKESFDKAQQYYSEKALQVLDQIVYYNLAIVKSQQSYHQWLSGQDPLPVLDSAFSSVEKVKDLQGGFSRSDHSLLSALHIFQVEFGAWGKGIDEKAMQKARYHAQQNLEKSADDADSLAQALYLCLLEERQGLKSHNPALLKKQLDQILRAQPYNVSFLFYQLLFELNQFRKQASWTAYKTFEGHLDKVMGMPTFEPKVPLLAIEACHWAAKHQAPGASPEAWRKRMQERTELATSQRLLVCPRMELWLAAMKQ